MAKQKSGLGKGLGALFNDASSYTAAQNEVQGNEPEPQAVPTEPAEAPVAPVEPVEKKPETEIYISEENLENAKVVEREARPARPAPVQPSKAKKAKNPNRPEPVKSRAQAAQKQASQSVSKASDAGDSGANSSKRATAATQAPAASMPKAGSKEEKGLVIEVPLASVRPNPDQPRRVFKPEEIEELASSIKRDGLFSPPLVRRMGDVYEIIAGERRWQACKSLGMETIPVRLWLADEDEALEIALIENIQRTDLNPIEEAYGYKRLMERRGMTQSEVAQTVSKGRSTIANALRLLDLPEEVQQLLFEEKITAGHARAILSVPTLEGRKSITNKLMNEKLSVRETESLARLLAGRENSKDTTVTRKAAPASFKKAARSMSKAIEMPVRVKTVQGKNKIEIQFVSEEDLQKIVNLLTK